MNSKTINMVMKYLILISALAVFIGALFKLQHYPYGDLFLMFGLFAHFLISSFEINRLKQIVGRSGEKKEGN